MIPHGTKTRGVKPWVGTLGTGEKKMLFFIFCVTKLLPHMVVVLGLDGLQNN